MYIFIAPGFMCYVHIQLNAMCIGVKDCKLLGNWKLQDSKGLEQSSGSWFKNVYV